MNLLKLYCVHFTDNTELSLCIYNSAVGRFFWTAGQRIDPTRNSTFIWRVKSTKTCDQTEYAMTYTNWELTEGEPNYGDPSGRPEACMHLWTYSNDNPYTWNDWVCNEMACFICEIDMTT